MKRRNTLALLLCAALLLPTGAGWAEKTPATAASVAEAAKVAKARYGGKILKVETVKQKKGLLYQVRILQDDGTIKTVSVQGR